MALGWSLKSYNAFTIHEARGCCQEAKCPLCLHRKAENRRQAHPLYDQQGYNVDHAATLSPPPVLLLTCYSGVTYNKSSHSLRLCGMSLVKPEQELAPGPAGSSVPELGEEGGPGAQAQRTSAQGAGVSRVRSHSCLGYGFYLHRLTPRGRPYRRHVLDHHQHHRSIDLVAALITQHKGPTRPAGWGLGAPPAGVTPAVV